MNDPRDAPFLQGVLLCRNHMNQAVYRGEYPGLVPPSLEEAIGDMHGELKQAFLTGYAAELNRHEGGVDDARRQLREVGGPSRQTKGPAI